MTVCFSYFSDGLLFLAPFFILLQIEMLADTTGQLTKVSFFLTSVLFTHCLVLLLGFYAYTSNVLNISTNKAPIIASLLLCVLVMATSV